MPDLKITFSPRKLKCCLILLLYFRPASYILGDRWYQILNYVSLGVMVLLGVELLVSMVRRTDYRPSKTALLLLALFFWVLIGSTGVNYLLGQKVSWTEAIRYFSDAAGFIMFIDRELYKNPKTLLSSFVLIGTIMCFINAITIFVFKSSGGMDANGLKARYFLAQDNATYYWTWTVMVVSWIYYFLYDRSRALYFYVLTYSAVTLASYIKAWAVAPMLATIMLAVTVLLYRRRASRDTTSARIRIQGAIGRFNLYWFTALLINYLVVVQQFYQKFVRLINRILHKSATLSGRAGIWQRSIHYIRRAPLIGYGQQSRTLTLQRIGINHTHNILLETMYRGGYVAMAIFLILLIYLGFKSKKIENSAYDFLMLAIFIFLFVSIADFAFYRFTYLIIFLLLERSELFVTQKAVVTSIIRRKKLHAV